MQLIFMMMLISLVASVMLLVRQVMNETVDDEGGE